MFPGERGRLSSRKQEHLGPRKPTNTSADEIFLCIYSHMECHRLRIRCHDPREAETSHPRIRYNRSGHDVTRRGCPVPHWTQHVEMKEGSNLGNWSLLVDFWTMLICYC